MLPEYCWRQVAKEHQQQQPSADEILKQLQSGRQHLGPLCVQFDHAYHLTKKML